MTDKLSIYNGALAHLKEDRLVSAAEKRGPRYKLDDQWDDAVAFCLQKGAWKFATRTSMLTASTSVTPSFGYTQAIKIPDDWVRTIRIATDDRFNGPLLEYNEEAGFWYCDWETIFVRYVSSDPTYGLNLGKWPPSFVELMKLRMATQAGPGISNDTALVAGLKKDEERYRIDAKALDAMGDPPKRPPLGSWVRSRFDRGNGFAGSGEDR